MALVVVLSLILLVFKLRKKGQAHSPSTTPESTNRFKRGPFCSPKKKQEFSLESCVELRLACDTLPWLLGLDVIVGFVSITFLDHDSQYFSMMVSIAAHCGENF